MVWAGEAGGGEVNIVAPRFVTGGDFRGGSENLHCPPGGTTTTPPIGQTPLTRSTESRGQEADITPRGAGVKPGNTAAVEALNRRLTTSASTLR
ncbi:hypothetical protein GCM10027020_06500 [Nocardioides salsibiostraticola]